MKLKSFVFALMLLALSPLPVWAADLTGCSLNGTLLYGKVEVVTSFPDFKVKVVDNFPDLEVQTVTNFPDSCGKWQFVEHFPDFTVQFVENFPDFTIRYVEHFPGTN